MPNKQLHNSQPIEFTCCSCGKNNQYIDAIVPGSQQDGPSTIVKKCQHCGTLNEITIEDEGWIFPRDTDLIRGE